MKNVFRFRSFDAVFGKRQELINRQIYFASLAELNDPMEGLRNTSFCGDRVVWENLIRHYTLFVENAIFELIINPEIEIDFRQLTGWLPSNLPTLKRIALHEDVYTQLVSDPDLVAFVEYLGSNGRPRHQNELTLYFTTIHGYVLSAVLKIFRQQSLVNLPPHLASIEPKGMNDLTKIVLRLDSVQMKIRGRLVSAWSTVHRRIALASLIINTESSPEPWSLICFDLPSIYFRSLDELTFGRWYVACFTYRMNNLSMWSNYASSHRGVCLRFRIRADCEGRDALTLRSATNPAEDRSFSLKKVAYSPTLPEVDFLESLGRHSVTELITNWYSGPDKVISPLYARIFQKPEEFRKRYRKNFDKITRCKLSDWEYESECRLVLSDLNNNSISKSSRILNYSPESLESVIFGINCPNNDKRLLMRSVCEQWGSGAPLPRFEQAFYCRTSGNIDSFPIA